MSTAEVDAILRARGLSPEQSDALKPYLTVAPPGANVLTELGSLSLHRDPGRSTTIRSRRPWNVLVQWRQLVVVGTKAAGAAVSAAAGGPIGVLAAIGIALAILPDLFELPSIDLGDQHQRVAHYLWIQRENDLAVRLGEIQDHFASAMLPEELENVLTDLARLRIIQRDSDEVVKRDELVGTAG